MAVFRDDEARQRGFEQAKNILIPRQETPKNRERSLEILHDLVDELGPVVDSYPTWHPLVSQYNHHHRRPYILSTLPGKNCGYEGLDHTVYFAHGFVTCPYNNSELVISSVNNIRHQIATITAERVDVPLYSAKIRCNWENQLDSHKFVSKRVAIGLMLDQEIPKWHFSEVGESWETMRRYFLGAPHGARSSLFVSADTANAMKKIWLSIIEVTFLAQFITNENVYYLRPVF